MSEKNQTHVAIDPDQATSWSFIVPSDAETADDQFEEAAALAREVLDASEEFLRPQRLVATRRAFGEEHEFPFEKVVPQATDRVPIEPEGTVAPDDVDADDLDVDLPALLLKVESDRTEVQVELADGTRYLDRTEDVVPYRDGEAQDREPNRDPLSVSVSHAEAGSRLDTDAEHIYNVSVSPHATIWFESSELGEANRERLVAYLERLDDALDSIHVRRTSNRYEESELSEIF